MAESDVALGTTAPDEGSSTGDRVSTLDKVKAPVEVAEEQFGYLPEPPEEPLPSDCCGSGCTPCVLDIYQEELDEWLRLKSMSLQERAKWRRELRVSSRGVSSPSRPVALSTAEYREFSVERVRQVAKDSFVFTFRLPADHRLGLQPGQHAVLRVREPNGHTLTRQYTPISPLDQTGSFDVLIKVYESGKMCRYVKEWTVGCVAEWRGPYGNFHYCPNKYERISMLACGTGIAPMVQLIRTVVENTVEDTFIHLVYGCRSQYDILLKEELNHFASFWNFTVLYALSQTSEQSLQAAKGLIQYGDRVHFGRVDCELVQKEMPSPEKEKNMVMICGTKSFDKDMINHLLKAGYKKDTYFKF